MPVVNMFSVKTRRSIAGAITRSTSWLDNKADQLVGVVHRFGGWADEQARKIWDVDEHLGRCQLGVPETYTDDFSTTDSSRWRWPMGPYPPVRFLGLAPPTPEEYEALQEAKPDEC